MADSKPTQSPAERKDAHLPTPWKTQRLDEHTILVMAADRSVVTSVGTWNNRDPEPIARLIVEAAETRRQRDVAMEALKRIEQNCIGGAVSIARNAIAACEDPDQ